MVSNPTSRARFASSGRTTPLRATGPSHSEQSHAASSQSKACEGMGGWNQTGWKSEFLDSRRVNLTRFRDFVVATGWGVNETAAV